MRGLTNGLKSKRQGACIGQPAFQVGCKAIARHHIKAGTGHQHDPGGRRFGAQSGERFEHVNFASDVEVMNTGRDAALGHRLGSA